MNQAALFLAAFFCFFSPVSFGQIQSKSVFCQFVCGHDHTEINLEKAFKFASEEEAHSVVREIMNQVGLSPNFNIQSAKIDNAAAIVYGTERYLLYNPQFISKVTLSSKTRWAAVSIMAHEIGHHLSGHTLRSGGSRPQMELEADEFSGFILRKLGASLKESQVAMQMLASPFGTDTHPGRPARLAAIEKGWNRADKLTESEGLRVSVSTSNMPENEPIKPLKEIEKLDIDPAHVLRKVVLTGNPNKQYFITTQHRFVTFKNGKMFILGKLIPNKEEAFPFIIKMKNSSNLRVNEKGELVTEGNRVVGYMIKIPGRDVKP